MEKRELKPGDVVQLRPDYGHPDRQCFGGCLLVVTEPKEFGCQGYITGPGESFTESARHYYLRPSWEDIEYVGFAEWIRDEKAD